MTGLQVLLLIALVVVIGGGFVWARRKKPLPPEGHKFCPHCNGKGWVMPDEYSRWLDMRDAWRRETHAPEA